MKMAQRNKIEVEQKSYARFCHVLFGKVTFFGTNLKEQSPCLLKPTRLSSTLEFTRFISLADFCGVVLVMPCSPTVKGK